MNPQRQRSPFSFPFGSPGSFALLVLGKLDYGLSNSPLSIIDHLASLSHPFNVFKIHSCSNDGLYTFTINPLTQGIQILADGVQEQVRVSYIPTRGAPFTKPVHEVERDADVSWEDRLGGQAHDAGGLELVAGRQCRDGDDHAGLGAKQTEVVHRYANCVEDEVY